MEVVFLGDTSDAESVADAAHGCDLLVRETTFEAGMKERAIKYIPSPFLSQPVSNALCCL
jgi:ribonuclease BN (tRNA processing enzyme)